MKISHLLESLLLAAVWGISFLFTRIAAPDLGPILLIELRLLLAGVTLLLLSTRLNLITQIRHNWLNLLILGIINSAIPFILFAFAALYLPAGFTSILNAAAPLFGTLIAGLWLKEKLTLGQFIGLVVGFAGVTILVGWTKIPVTPEFTWAVAAGLIWCFFICRGCTLCTRQISRSKCDRRSYWKSVERSLGFIARCTLVFTQYISFNDGNRRCGGFGLIFYCPGLCNLFSSNR